MRRFDVTAIVPSLNVRWFLTVAHRSAESSILSASPAPLNLRAKGGFEEDPFEFEEVS